MKTRIFKTFAVLSAAATMMFSAASASAALIYTTPTQTQNFSFATLNDPNAVLAFNGFNVTQGVLQSVTMAWSITSNLNNALFNTNPTASSVGTPIPMTATATTTFNGTGPATALSGINTLTTPGFVGSIPGGNTITTVGTATQTGIAGGMTSTSNLASYIGGTNLFNISVSNFGTQGGSVPPGVFSGNNGTANGSVSIYYTYTIPSPATLALIGLGLFGMIALRRRANA